MCCCALSTDKKAEARAALTCVFPQDLSKTLLMYTVPAVQGFFRSISLSRGNNLQDTLRYRGRERETLVGHVSERQDIEVTCQARFPFPTAVSAS